MPGANSWAARKCRYRSSREIRHYARMADEALGPDGSEVAVDFDTDGRVLTLTSEVFVLRINASAEDLARLDRAPTADWSRREAIAVGTTTLGQVFWCAGATPETVHVLVGIDDETWDLALVIPGATVEAIVRRAAETQGA